MDKLYRLEIYWKDNNKILHEPYFNFRTGGIVVEEYIIMRREASYIISNGFTPKYYNNDFCTHVRVEKIEIVKV
jgi:hypothetical protein